MPMFPIAFLFRPGRVPHRLLLMGIWLFATAVPLLHAQQVGTLSATAPAIYLTEPQRVQFTGTLAYQSPYSAATLAGLTPTYELTQAPSRGTVAFSGLGGTYTPGPDFDASGDTFSYRIFYGTYHTTNATVTLTASAQPPASLLNTNSTHTNGEITTLVVILGFADAPATFPSNTTVSNAFGDLDDWLRKRSYNKAWFNFTLVPTVAELPGARGDYGGGSAGAGFQNLVNEAESYAVSQGYTGDYKRLWVGNTPISGGTGLADTGGRDLIVAFGSSSQSKHEFGHTFGVSHPEGWDTRNLYGPAKFAFGWLKEYATDGYRALNISDRDLVYGVHELIDSEATANIPGALRLVRYSNHQQHFSGHSIALLGDNVNIFGSTTFDFVDADPASAEYDLPRGATVAVTNASINHAGVTGVLDSSTANLAPKSSVTFYNFGPLPRRQGISGALVGAALVDNFHQPPLPVPDLASTASGTPVVLSPLANDYDPQGLDLHIAGVSSFSEHGGTVTHTETTLTYTPPAGFTGIDSLRYVAGNGYHFAASTLHLTVGNPNPGLTTLAVESFESGTLAYGFGWSGDWSGPDPVATTLPADPAGLYYAAISGSESLTRSLDLSLRSQLQLSFNFRKANNLTFHNKNGILEGWNGSAWVELWRTPAGNVASSWTPASVDLSPLANFAAAQLRFRTDATDNSDTLHFDQLVLTSSAPAPAPGSYTAWRNQLSWNGLNSAPDAIISPGQIPNFMAYAMDLNPQTATTEFLPSIDRQSLDGYDWLHFTYRRSTSAASLPVVRSSPSLSPATWTDLIPNGTTIIEEILDPDPDGDGSAQLIRLRVRLDPGEPLPYLSFALTAPEGSFSWVINLPPTVAALTADQTTASRARLNTTLNPGSAATTVTFYYGLTDGGLNPAAWTRSIVLPATSAAGTVSAILTQLLPRAGYYARVSAANEQGTVWSDVFTFSPDTTDTSTWILKDTYPSSPAAAWETASHWSPATVPNSANATAHFEQTVYITSVDYLNARNAVITGTKSLRSLLVTPNVQNVTYTATPLTFTGASSGTLQLGAGGFEKFDRTGTTVFETSLTMNLTANQTWSNHLPASGTTTSLTLKGPISLANHTLAFEGVGNIALNSKITGTGSSQLVHRSTGTLTLGLANNSAVPGGLRVENGVAILTNANSVLAPIHLSAPAILDISENLSFPGLTSPSGTVRNSNNAGRTLTLNTPAGSPFTFSGNFDRGTKGALSLTKSGNGTQILAGTNNTYTGNTSVNGGNLIVNGSLSANATGLVNVNANATLGGNGTIGRTVNINANGTIAPGHNGIGNLTAASLSLNGSATYLCELGNNATSDRVVVTGNATLDGTLLLSGTIAPGTYRVLTCAGVLTDNVLDVAGVPAPYTANLVVAGGNVDLVVTSTASTTFAQWKIDTGLPGAADPSQDHNGNGAPELFDFLFANDHFPSARPHAPTISMIPGTPVNGDSNYLQVEFRRRKPFDGVTYQLRSSTTLGGWTDAAPVEVILDNSSPTYDIVALRVPAAGNPKLFLRLVVWESPSP